VLRCVALSPIACPAKGSSMQKRPSPGHLIAKKSFDTGELFKLYEDRAFQLNEAARLEVIEGLTFVATPRGVLPREHVPGAGRAAEANAGKVGHFMRMVRRKGYDSKSPAVIDALEQQKLEVHRKGFQAHLRKVRKNKDTRIQEEAVNAVGERFASLREIVDNGDVRIIEEGFAKLSDPDKQRLKIEAEFDGNHEKHYGIARYLVDVMKRFTYFAGRDLNSHHESVPGYLRMYSVFEPIRAKLSDRSLNVDELIEILKARLHPEHR
jgi:hypothetical protein